jgi:hypothetical protein
MKISAAQITKLHVLLNQLGWINDKKEIISNYTNARTESSKDLSFDEAKYLIQQICEHDPRERLKSLVFSLAYRAGIIYGSSNDDKKINAAKLNLFLLERGAVKKELNKLTYAELIKVHRQFEAIVKNVGKSTDNKAADKLVGSLLDELNMNVLTH